MKIRLLITSVLLIAVCVAWIYPFLSILRYGTHLVQEPNLPILLLEIFFFTGTVVFALSNLLILFVVRKYLIDFRRRR